MLPFTHSRRSSAILAFFILAVLLLLWNHDEAVAHLPTTILPDFTPAVWSDYLSAGDVAPLVGTANATLGFDAILAVSPRTTWRSAGLHAAAQRTNLSITIPPQRPPTSGETAAFMALNPSGILNEGSARAWLAHLQVMRAAQNYSSALILEDDADWDVRVHRQAGWVAEAVRNLTVPRTETREWPWGEDWDVLWLGHCGERLPYDEDEEPGEEGPGGGGGEEGVVVEAEEVEVVTEKVVGADGGSAAPDEGAEEVAAQQQQQKTEQKENLEAKVKTPTSEKLPIDKAKRLPPGQLPGEDDYITMYDPTLPPTIGSYDPRMSGDSEETRWVQHAAGPICTFAYAVTAASVAKMLAMRHGDEQAFDLWMHSRCRSRELRCFTVNPEMFHHHVAAGLPSSLVNEGQVGGSGKNYTENIMYSARCNWDKPDDQLVSCRKS
ncbi:glycosyltransferase family 25 protein [Diplodia corticola]|uniref:Glycosyltransferase family 25 protein n=1 Tax=Diplodia corticola TaxID=236234 RepID=A0A1J9QZS7_9PEZI|nr:glycosyltransferase family 25 protein [Diplodia corticola]OJD33873.1 glycosyltransferase family 25 protein [Diplodia corticola]